MTIKTVHLSQCEIKTILIKCAIQIHQDKKFLIKIHQYSSIQSLLTAQPIIYILFFGIGDTKINNDPIT